MTIARNRVARLMMALMVVGQPMAISAHEGHQALPTRGAQVDVAKGQITLSPAAYKALGIATADVELRPADQRVLAYATLEPTWHGHAFVASQLAGRVDKVHIKPGDTVKKGQPLADIASLELADLQLELRNGAVDVRLAEKIRDQLKDLARQQIVAERELREAESKLREHTNAMETARAKLLGLGLSEDAVARLLENRDGQPVRSLPILSPIDGTVIHADVSVGRVVEPGEHLFEVMNSDTVWVRIDVLEKDLHRVNVGQTVELRLSAYPEQILRTTIQVKGLRLDPVTHLGPVWGELQNRADSKVAYLPGMSGEAQIQVAKAEKLVTVPAAALLGEGAERYLLVETAATELAHEYRKQNVAVAAQNSQSVQISGGSVFPGDRVVIAGGHELATYFVPTVLRLSPEAEKNIGLRVEEAARRPIEQVAELDGAVDVPPTRRGAVSSQLSGRLQRILVDRSQPVHVGDIVAELTSLDFQNLQLDFLRAHLESKLLAESLEHLKTLDREQAANRRMLWETESGYNSAVNRRERSKRKLLAVGASAEQVEALSNDRKLLKTLPLRAPIDGVVVEFGGVLGQSVKPDERLFQIHDLSRSWIRVDLSEQELAQVQLGEPARVRLVSDPAFVGEGTAVRSGGMLNSESRTLSLWVELKQQPAAPLEHDMLARVALTVGKPETALAVPLGAILREGTATYVFVRKPDGIFERRAVELGRADDRYIEIKSGLHEREIVASHGTAGLQTAYAVIR